MRREAAVQKKDFEKTVATWEHSVTFETIISLAGGGPQVLVGTDDEIYGYVNDGTRPHPIRAKNAPMLVFQSGYTAKTQPNKIASRQGGSSGPLVFTKEVQHPGTKARNFDEVIQKKNQPRFKRAMEKAMLKGAEKAGLR